MMQPVKFRSVEDFLDFLPEHELRIVQALRQLTLECIPNVKEKLSYNVPYYSRHKRICFIWPASVPWGNIKLQGVQFGFCYGNLMRDELNYLDRGSRKQVYSKTFMSLQEIDTDLLKLYLFEAVRVDAGKE